MIVYFSDIVGHVEALSIADPIRSQIYETFNSSSDSLNQKCDKDDISKLQRKANRVTDKLKEKMMHEAENYIQDEQVNWNAMTDEICFSNSDFEEISIETIKKAQECLKSQLSGVEFEKAKNALIEKFCRALQQL